MTTSFLSSSLRPRLARDPSINRPTTHVVPTFPQSNNVAHDIHLHPYHRIKQVSCLPSGRDDTGNAAGSGEHILEQNLECSSCTAAISTDITGRKWKEGSFRSSLRRWFAGFPGSAATPERGLLDGRLALLGAVVLPSACNQALQELAANHVFMAGFVAWFFAQSGKIFTKRYKKGVWDIRAFTDSGGMPSSHSALCMAVTTAIARNLGLSSAIFAVSLAFSLIVMYDAAGVRRHAGKQAEVLNILLTDVVEGHPVSEQKLKEVLGHTPRQVLAGGILGVVTGLLIPMPANPQML